jgi:ribonuclease R
MNTPSKQSQATVESLCQQILVFLERFPNELFKSKEMSRRIGIRKERDYLVFKEALRILQDEKKIERVHGKKYGHLHIPQQLIGTLEVTTRGFGVVTITETGEEIFIREENLESAMHGDKVEIALLAQSTKQKERDARREGAVEKILQRGIQILVGTVERVRKMYFVIPADKRVAREIMIEHDQLGGAKENDKVVVEVTAWGRQLQGRVVEVLGRAGEMSAEVRSVARAFNLPAEFPADVLAEVEAALISIPPTEIARRLDLRNENCVTIDPQDAKDFDDAVSLDVLPDGNYRLGVHIADVSYYVNEGTALDKEAIKRGTSVYFPNGVIPMLPEHLSNNLCSLRPNEDKLTFSVMMIVTPRGAVNSYEIRESVIRSKRRFAYEQVQQILDGQASGQPVAEEDAPFLDMLVEMHKLSSVLTKKRMREGSVDFASAEAKFVFDEQGKPIDIVKKVRLDAHRLVEEFMLLANRVVAKHIGFSKNEELPKPFLYRVHDTPDPDRIRELSLFVAKFGFKLNLDGGVSSKELQKLIEQVKGTEVENVINDVALRSMAKAIYSEHNIGHYGLAFEYYSHFTSPIRRYPDLIVHRMLKQYQNGITLQEREAIRKRLPFIAKQSSAMERLAMEAERAAIKVVQVEYMKRHIGDEFAAVISGVTTYGIFVELNDVLVEGLVRVRDMDDDYYTFDEKQYALKGKRTGKQYRLGDTVHVKVIRVNPEQRQIDFLLIQEIQPKIKSRGKRIPGTV